MGILAALILLPIIPAYLLFTALPGHAAVTGPLRGFRINLSGAFAGYFATVLLCIASYSVWKPVPKAAVQKWLVRGRIVGNLGLPIQPLDVTNVTLSPPTLQPANDGNFLLTFTSTPTDDGAALVYPDLVITANGYKARTIALDPAAWQGIPAQTQEQWKKTHIIDLSNIAMEPLPPYQPEPVAVK